MLEWTKLTRSARRIDHRLPREHDARAFVVAFRRYKNGWSIAWWAFLCGFEVFRMKGNAL